MAQEKRRSKTITQLFTALLLNDATTSSNSSTINVGDYTDFLLYLDIDSTNAPTDVQFIVQFSNDGGTTWFDYKNDFFGDLRYEDTATASGLKECVSGKCGGRTFRLRAVGAGTTSTATFLINAYIEFFK